MKRTNCMRTLASVAGALLLMAGLLVQFGGSAASAQAAEAHPAHIHTGLCPAPGAVVYPLTNVSSAMAMNGTPMASSSAAGAQSAIPVESSVTTVKAALKDLVDGKHSIVVHESMAKMGNYLVCGDIGGTMMGTSDLAVGLGALNNSGYDGIATLHDNGDGSTAVTIYLKSTSMPASGGASPTAAAANTTAAASKPAAANGVAVEIKDYAYNQASIDVPVGTTVTWTNDDSVPHTVTEDGGGFSSPVLNPGDTFSQTFKKAGSFTYHCEFHANMKGKITVK